MPENNIHDVKAKNSAQTEKNDVRIYLMSSCILRRAGLESICEHEDEFSLVGVEDKLPEDIETFTQTHPDLIVVDQALFNSGHTPEAETTLHHFHELSHVIVLADQIDLPFACSAIADGAEGYMLTSNPMNEILQALRVVALGGMWLEQNIIRMLANQAITASNQVTENEHNHPSRLLSERELQILHGIAKGQTSKEIAGHLYLSESSVRTYWYRVLSKLNALNKSEALVIASQMGLLNTPQLQS